MGLSCMPMKSFREAKSSLRVSVVVLSRNYASSRWCLDELVEILKCREEIGCTVIPVFNEVNQSDVRNLTGDFGIAFNETFVGSTEVQRRRWRQALNDVANILGSHSHNRDQESTLIERISLAVLNNVTRLSVGSEDNVGNEPHLEHTQPLLNVETDGEAELEQQTQTQPPPLHLETDGEAQVEQTEPPLYLETDGRAQPEQTQSFLVEEIVEAHLEEVQSLLHLDDEDKIMIVGIYGPLGTGKTTIAKTLRNRLSTSFQSTGFVENLRESYPIGLDGNDLKLHLQNQLLSKIFNQNGIGNGTFEELRHLKVLIILDDVDDLKQLDALANETTWLGPGSRIVVTTESNELLQQHGINSTYHVDFPSREEALKILCSYAFKQSFPPNDFKELAESVVDLCGNLPSCLRKEGLVYLGRGRTRGKLLSTGYKLRIVEPSSMH